MKKNEGNKSKRIILYCWLLVFVFLIGLAKPVKAQISQGGIPISFGRKHKSSVKVPVEVMPEVDVQSLLEEDACTESQPDYPFRFSKNFLVNYTLFNSGVWEELDDGGKLWRIGLVSPGAWSMHIIFNEYRLPPGAKVFIYNSDKTQIIGAFTSRNNKPWGSLAVAPLSDDEIVVEYYEPKNAGFNGQLSIGQVGHGYKDVFGIEDDGYGLSQACNKDINCPEGDDWQVEKHAICRIIFSNMNGNSFLCTGSLINNTRNDGTPYFLSAFHCITTYYEAQTAIFYFNYESPTCNGPDVDTSQTISGSIQRAKVPYLDFSLVEMSEIIPASYEPYFAGWDISFDPPTNVTGIHHPRGDVKKITYSDFSPVTGDFDNQNWDFDDSTHWFVEKWTLGIMEGGSSGSPLFNQNHHIVGDLSGGNFGNCTSSDAFYAKLSHSWADYNGKSEQLKYWLDPDTSNITSLNGFSPTGLFVQSPLSPDQSINLYPNPAKETFTIEIKKPGFRPERIEIYNMLGKKVFEKKLTVIGILVKVQPGRLPSGIYVIRVHDHHIVVSKKIWFND